MPSVVDTNLRVSFVACTNENFLLLSPKDDNTVYFITDTHLIYKGNTLYTDSGIQFVPTVPEFDTAESDVLYVVSDGETITTYVKGSQAMLPAGGGSGEVQITDLDSILDKTADGALTNDDTKIPTSGAVNAAIEEALSGYTGAIVDVSADRSEDNSGTVITFTPKEGEPKTVTISDLFLSAASYDSESHQLSLTVKGSDSPVTVDLGELIPEAVSTTDVAMASNIVCTVDVGNYKKGDTIDISTVENLQQFLVGMLSEDSNPTTTQPSASVTLQNAGAKEVGTEFTPNWTVNFNPGAYSANAEGAQPTGVTATEYAVTDTNSNDAATQTGSFSGFTVTDDTNYRVTATVTHTAGNVPTTFLGKPYEAGKIQAGSKVGNSSYVTGFRQGMYGALTDKTGEINSALVRSVSGRTNKAVAKGQKYTITVPAGTLRVILAYPATIGAVASITSAEEFGSEIKDSFVRSTASVEGANSYTGINYNVYVKDLASPQVNATTYSVTI